MSRSLQLGLRTGDLYVSSNPSIPRSCSIQITKLKITKGLSKEEPHLGFYLALQASSRRVQARLDEMIMPPFSESGESELKFHNPLNVSFEYQHFTKGRPNLLYISLQKKKKYRTRAVPGYKTLARGQINLDDIIQLPPPKHFTVRLLQTDKDSKETKHIEIGGLEISEVSSIPTDEDDSKYLFDSSDEEENISSEQRKLNKTNSVASRMKNAMLSKILAKLIKTNPHINPEDIDMDVQDLNEIDISELQLYDELEDFAISDEDDEIFDHDDVSIASTPRPNLKPYFDSASQCSLQPRTSVGNYSSSRTGTYKGLASVNEEEKRKNRTDSYESTEGDNTSAEDEAKRTSKKIKRGQKSFDDAGESCLHSDSDALLTEIVESDKPLFLLIREAANEHLVEEILRCATAVKMVDIHSEAIQDAFAVIVKRVHEKSLATKIVDPVRICICGTVENVNSVVKIYLDQISKKSSEWTNFFSFMFLPLDDPISRHHLPQRLGELCPVYRNLFLDSNWVAGDGLAAKIERVVNEATKVTHIPVAEAMVSFFESRSDGNTQIFVPFCVEMFVQETDNDDTDSADEAASRQVTSPTSSPFISSNPQSIHSAQSEKLHLSIEYWTEDKSSKQSIKETLRSLEFQPTKNSILMKLQCRPKRTGITHLPGRKRKDADSGREKREHVTRVICKSKEKSKMAKLTIDGFEYENISFFQISRSNAATSQAKTLPVALFTQLDSDV